MTSLIVTLWATIFAALDFETSSSQYIQASALPISGYPLTVTATYTNESLGATRTAWSLCDSASSNNFHQVALLTAGAGNYSVDAGVSIQNATTANTVGVGERAHLVGIGTSATDRRAILNGDWANSGTNTTSRTPASLDRTGIGRWGGSIGANYADGIICQVAGWSAALSQTEVESLAAGAAPYQVRRSSLVTYHPLGTADTSPNDLVTGTTYSGTAPVAVGSTWWPRRSRAR